MKRNYVRQILGGLSFTSALFVFQACYGPSQDFGYDLLLEGQVKAKNTGHPIPGIKVSVAESMQYQHTDAEGKFSFYTIMNDSLAVSFEDVDSIENGSFVSCDTVISPVKEQVYLTIELEEN